MNKGGLHEIVINQKRFALEPNRGGELLKSINKTHESVICLRDWLGRNIEAAIVACAQSFPAAFLATATYTNEVSHMTG